MKLYKPLDNLIANLTLAEHPLFFFFCHTGTEQLLLSDISPCVVARTYAKTLRDSVCKLMTPVPMSLRRISDKLAIRITVSLKLRHLENLQAQV